MLQQKEEPQSFRSRLCALDGTEMERRPISFALAISDNPIHFDDITAEPVLSKAHYLLNTRQGEPLHHLSTSPTSSPSPPPPPRGSFVATRSPSPLLICGRDTPPLQETHPVRLRSIRHTNSLENLVSNIPRPLTGTHSATKRRLSDPTFHKSVEQQLSSSAGEEIARFSVSYIGSCSIDQYLGCVDECAKKVINPKVSSVKSTDVLIQICTEKIRLFPPPKRGPLFKSFSVSEIVSVSRCSKNKRLVGLVIWKRKDLPQCHLMRCPDHIGSNALLQSIEFAIQNSNEFKVL